MYTWNISIREVHMYIYTHTYINSRNSRLFDLIYLAFSPLSVSPCTYMFIGTILPLMCIHQRPTMKQYVLLHFLRIANLCDYKGSRCLSLSLSFLLSLCLSSKRTSLISTTHTYIQCIQDDI